MLAEGDQAPSKLLETARELYATLTVKLKLETEGGIAKTDATFPAADGGSLILMDLDFPRLMKKPGDFTRLMSIPDSAKTYGKFERASRGLPGMRLELKPEITVTLK